MKIKIFTFLLLLLHSVVFSQNVGDYRSVNSGNWAIASSWQVWNGSAWVAATQYPGQTSGTYSVTIQDGNTITVGTYTNGNNNGPSLTVSYNIGNVLVLGQLTLNINLELNTTASLILDAGVVLWNQNNVYIKLQQNAEVSIINSGSGSCNNSSGLNGYGFIGGSCSNNTSLEIGNVTYSNCAGNGNAIAGTFCNVVEAGGTINATPIASTNQICFASSQNNSVLLTAPTNSNISATKTYEWSVVSSPIGFSGITTTNTQTFTVNNLIVGTYVFKLKITVTKSGNNYSAEDTVTVNVYQPTSSGSINNINICSKYNTGNVLTLSGYFGNVVKWQSALDNSFTSGVTDIANTSASLILANNLTTDLYYRAVLTNGVCNGFSSVASVRANSTTYSGSWSNGAPDVTKRTIFTSTYTLPSDFTACAVEVRNNAIVTIPINNNLTVDGEIEVISGNILVESDANFNQIRKDVTNTGNITVRRNAQLKRLDYNYWGSPVNGQDFKTFSPQTINSRFYTYNESDDSFVSVPDVFAPFVAGKGYAIRAPNNYSTTVQTFVGEFKGVPNNGDITIPVSYSGATRGNNMLANPYPSRIDLRILHQKNPSLSGGVFYFWTNDANSWTNNNNTSNGSFGTYTKNQYAVLNLLGAIPASTPAEMSPKYPSAIIKPGQGFIMQVSAAGNLLFDNTMRTSATTDGTNTSVFFNKLSGNNKSVSVSEISGRYWLSLTSPVGAKNILLVGYINNADNKFDKKYDAEILSVSSDAFYSITADKKLAIQGRNTNNLSEDVVPIGVSHYMPGSYTIAIENKDGVFINTQNIFLKDNELNTITDLSKSSYTYESNTAGVADNRFEIIYQNTQSVLQTTNPNLDHRDLWVYKSNGNIIVKSNQSIDQLEIYDATGRLLYKQKNVKQKEQSIDANKLVNGINFILITRNNTTSMIKTVK